MPLIVFLILFTITAFAYGEFVARQAGATIDKETER